jgi:hypothetical protein
LQEALLSSKVKLTVDREAGLMAIPLGSFAKTFIPETKLLTPCRQLEEYAQTDLFRCNKLIPCQLEMAVKNDPSQIWDRLSAVVCRTPSLSSELHRQHAILYIASVPIM